MHPYQVHQNPGLCLSRNSPDPTMQYRKTPAKGIALASASDQWGSLLARVMKNNLTIYHQQKSHHYVGIFQRFCCFSIENCLRFNQPRQVKAEAKSQTAEGIGITDAAMSPERTAHVARSRVMSVSFCVPRPRWKYHASPALVALSVSAQV